jgi:predicted metal-dependent peptidase
MKPSSQAERISRARMAVILDAPFFGSLLMRLRMIEDPSVETFCTNGKVIRYSPEFAASLDDAELRGVLVHEVCHCAQGHLWRMGSRDPQKWNVAADYAINTLLESYVAEQKQAFEAKHGSNRFLPPWALSKGGLIDPAFKNLSSEEIYARLPDGPNSGGGSAGGQAVGPGQFEAPDEDPAAPTTSEQDWKIAVTQAATVQKMQGKLPASLQRFVEELLEPKVPWREVLREFVRQHARDDYSFRRPNRRYAGNGVMLPSLYSERMGRLAIGVDTSGSITDEVLAEFQAEIQAALDECQPECVEVIYCDAAVNGVQEFLPGDAVRLTPKGGGGTDFTPVFEHICQSGSDPVACIYLTDGYGTFPEKEPAYPVLWATTASEEFPWGQVVAVK